MAHIPYGYIISDGKAVVDNEKAEQVRILFLEYLSGASLSVAAKNSCIAKSHTAIGLLLENENYIGRGFYPPLLNKEIYENAQIERKRRAIALGRDNKVKPAAPQKAHSFSLGATTETADIKQKISASTDKNEIQSLLLTRAEALYISIQTKELE